GEPVPTASPFSKPQKEVRHVGERYVEAGGGEYDSVVADSGAVIEIEATLPDARQVAEDQRSIVNGIGRVPLDQLEQLGVRPVVEFSHRGRVGRIVDCSRPFLTEPIA